MAGNVLALIRQDMIDYGIKNFNLDLKSEKWEQLNLEPIPKIVYIWH